MIARVASGLVRHQLVSKGSVVTVYSSNCIEYAVIYLAVSSAGGIVSAVNPAYTVSEYSLYATMNVNCDTDIDAFSLDFPMLSVASF